jgi:hypothetical protein
LWEAKLDCGLWKVAVGLVESEVERSKELETVLVSVSIDPFRPGMSWAVVGMVAKNYYE